MAVYPTYILPFGWWYATCHLLREPGNSIDVTSKNSKRTTTACELRLHGEYFAGFQVAWITKVAGFTKVDNRSARWCFQREVEKICSSNWIPFPQVVTGWKWCVFFFSLPIQAANEKYLKPPNSGIHGESELLFPGKMEPRYPPMPFCWIAQAESFKNIPGSVDFKTHTRGLMLQQIRGMPQNEWNPSK